jgi:hypothetical protein
MHHQLIRMLSITCALLLLAVISLSFPLEIVQSPYSSLARSHRNSLVGVSYRTYPFMVTPSLLKIGVAQYSSPITHFTKR